MTEWTKISRFHRILSGEKADRPIVTGWTHFLDEERNGQKLGEATIAFAKKYDWDWIKINPRATYVSEAFGNKFDYTDYRGVLPRQIHTAIQKPSDIWKIEPQNVKTSAIFQEQLQSMKLIREALPDTPIVQTIFSPLTALLFLFGKTGYINHLNYGPKDTLTFEQLFQEERAGVHQALYSIAITLADYVKELEEIGVDGIFYAVTGTAHPELFDEASFNEFSRPYDAIVLNAMEKGKRILHTCGSHSHPERFNDYPIEGISWDTKAEGNPDLDADLRPVKIAGVDHQIFRQENKKEIQKQANTALKLMKDNPFILAPNCGVPTNAEEECFFTLKNSVMERENN